VVPLDEVVVPLVDDVVPLVDDVVPQQKPIQLISLVRPIIKIGVKQDNMFAKLPIELIKSTFYVQ